MPPRRPDEVPTDATLAELVDAYARHLLTLAAARAGSRAVPAERLAAHALAALAIGQAITTDLYGEPTAVVRRQLGYTGSANLLVRYLNQGRAHDQRAAPPPRRLVGWIMSRAAELPQHERSHLDDLLTACPHLTVLTEHVRAFAELLTTRRGEHLQDWMSAVDAGDLPALHAFVRGLCKDFDAVVAGLSLPYSNGPIEGTNTKFKLLKRQMYGRAGFALLRQRILLS